MKRLINKMRDKTAADNVRKLGSVKWDPKNKDVIAYRVQLLHAQEWTCTYCRRPIYRDELGFRELDHVLPKSQTPSEAEKFDVARARSNLSDDRRITHGFKGFTHSPENLVIACKRCNSHKGTYDGFADRTNRPAQPVVYPTLGRDFDWINPHCISPESHIEILDGYVYRAKNGSKKGKAVIHECGLDKVEQLKARTLDALVFSYHDLIEAMIEAILSRENFDSDHIADTLHRQHPHVPLVLLKDGVRLVRREREEHGGAGLTAAMQVVIKKLAELDALPEPNGRRPELDAA